MPTFSFRRAARAAALGVALAAAASASIAVGAGGEGSEGYPPDPPGNASTKQWVFEVVVTKGVPTLTKARAVTIPRPLETRRVMGRFAVELFVGTQLLDRIRFDIPLMGGGPVEKSPRHPFPRPDFEHVNTRLDVQMADHPRAVYAVLVDRATRKTTRYQWPPEADGRLLPWTPVNFSGADAWPPPGTKDAGARDARGGG